MARDSHFGDRLPLKQYLAASRREEGLTGDPLIVQQSVFADSQGHDNRLKNVGGVFFRKAIAYGNGKDQVLVPLDQGRPGSFPLKTIPHQLLIRERAVISLALPEAVLMVYPVILCQQETALEHSKGYGDRELQVRNWPPGSSLPPGYLD